MNTALQSVRRAYKEWGIPEGLLKDSTDEANLTAVLEAAEPAIPGMRARIFPSSFDANSKALRAFPRALDWKWSSCERALRESGSTVVMMRLPLFWQLESPLHAACRSVGAPIFVNEPENMPVGAAAIYSASVDTVVSASADAFSFVSYMLEKKVALPRVWVLVHEAQGEWRIPAPLESASLNVSQEVHLFPSTVLLSQCAHLAASKKSDFHIFDGYSWELLNDASYITSAGDDPLPLYRYKLPFKLVEAEKCACGRTVVRKA